MAELSIMASGPGQPTIVRLRVQLAAASRAAMAMNLPTAPQCWSGTDPAALWIGPDQWLLISERLSAEQIIMSCQERLPDTLHAGTDCTDELACLAIDGNGARELLAMGSGVDFHVSAFGINRCVRTRMAKIAVIVRSMSEARFEMFIDRSTQQYFERYLRRSLKDPLLHRQRL